MTRFNPTIGTPAYRFASGWTPPYLDKVAWRLKQIAGFVAEATYGCRHRHITLPFNDFQTCLACGATRLYLYNTEMFFAGQIDTPAFIGRWKKAVR